MRIKKKGNYLEIAGKLYKVIHEKSIATDKYEDMEFEEVKSPVDKMIKEIALKLKESVNAQEIIENALYDIDEKNLKILYAKIKKQKTRPKIKKTYGCLDLNVGGVHIPIR